MSLLQVYMADDLKFRLLETTLKSISPLTSARMMTMGSWMIDFKNLV